ncbi:uncharacterized protein C8orf76 homolog [Cyrtonyx montezumae]|uniref:uncharacterized protein C8orf76 homolog n=1 Tax=Cyrtonyx montezumae TaxID=9017 RepID=UPI0032D9CA1C
MAGRGRAGGSRSGKGMEPPLGWEFEEAVFTQSRERATRGSAGPPYSAKRCEPRWFCAETSGGEDGEALTAHKFRAELAYREREFEKALCEYSNCLQLLPPSNVAMRRDVQEGQARCLSRLGRHKEALDIAERMRNGATNTDHLTSVLNLQFAIYRDLENIEKQIVCLQQLICLHPFNPWYWKSLAGAYVDLLQSLSPLCIPEMNLNWSKEVSDGRFKISAGGDIDLQPHRSHGQREGPGPSPAAETKSESAATCSSSQAVKEICTSDNPGRKAEGKHTTPESWEQDVAKDVGLKACASLVRARLLLQLTQLQQSSFALENNIKCQKEIDDKVAQFGLNENSLLQVTKVMGADLVPEKLKEEFQGEVKCMGPSALSSLVTSSASEFEIKWFDILRRDLCHLDRHFSSDVHLPPSAM